MLVIRKEQMAAFEQYMLKNFLKRMGLHLRTVCPEETSDMSDEELHALIQTGIDKVKPYGIVRDDDFKRFLEYMVTHGPDFDQDDRHPEVQNILCNTTMDGEEKMDEIDFYYDQLGED